MDGSRIENSVNDTDKLLVLLVGQSNMAGRGFAGPDDLTVIPNLLMPDPDSRPAMMTTITPI